MREIVMKKKMSLLKIQFFGLLVVLSTSLSANTIENKVNVIADIQRGQLLWKKSYKGIPPYEQRSCQSCHGKDLSQVGHHIKTKRVIKAMAPSVNSQRFSNPRKVAKWFLRNCKWTMGKECTVQEKADILAYLKSL